MSFVKKQNTNELRCSFCGKAQSEVKKLIAGAQVYICNECIDICNAIISDDYTEEQEQSAAHNSDQFINNTGASTRTMSTPTESANLILKLYELRRDEKMRQARDWFARFDPQKVQDIVDAVMSEQSSAYYRMVTSYWDMTAVFVNNGAIDEKMFNDANGEHIFIFAKIEPFLAELRQMFNSPGLLANLEQLVMRLPDAPKRLEGMRERSRRMAQMRAQVRNDAAQEEASMT